MEGALLVSAHAPRPQSRDAHAATSSACPSWSWCQSWDPTDAQCLFGWPTAPPPLSGSTPGRASGAGSIPAPAARRAAARAAPRPRTLRQHRPRRVNGALSPARRSPGTARAEEKRRTVPTLALLPSRMQRTAPERTPRPRHRSGRGRRKLRAGSAMLGRVPCFRRRMGEWRRAVRSNTGRR
jgi:hypothetical protein